MKIIISNRSELPIYAQIEEQIREQILSGDLPEGTVLPSIRKLAAELSVSVITTSRAYSELEKNGFVAGVQGKGSVVLSQNNALLREQYLKRIEEGLNQAIDTAKKLGMSREELDGMLELLWQNIQEEGS